MISVASDRGRSVDTYVEHVPAHELEHVPAHVLEDVLADLGRIASESLALVECFLERI